MDIGSEDKSTSIRVNESTKRLLGSVAAGQESFNDTIRRLVAAYNNQQAETSRFVKKGNILGTEMERTRKTFFHDTPQGAFMVVCSCNDLRSFSNLRMNKMLYNTISQELKGSMEWEIDLQILSIRKSNHPGRIQDREYLDVYPNHKKNSPSDQHLRAILYFISLKKIIEETFLVQFYEFIIEPDFFSWDKWKSAYARNNLSEESFRKDVEKKLRDLEFASFPFNDG